MPEKTATPWSDWSDANSKAIEAAEGESEGALSEQGAHEARCSVAVGSAFRYERTLFVLSNAGRILCLSPDQGEEMKAMMASGWKHTATIDPALWIKSLMEAEPDRASDMMDELNFGPNAEISHDQNGESL